MMSTPAFSTLAPELSLNLSADSQLNQVWTGAYEQFFAMKFAEAANRADQDGKSTDSGGSSPSSDKSTETCSSAPSPLSRTGPVRFGLTSIPVQPQQPQLQPQPQQPTHALYGTHPQHQFPQPQLPDASARLPWTVPLPGGMRNNDIVATEPILNSPTASQSGGGSGMRDVLRAKGNAVLTQMLETPTFADPSPRREAAFATQPTHMPVAAAYPQQQAVASTAKAEREFAAAFASALKHASMQHAMAEPAQLPAAAPASSLPTQQPLDYAGATLSKLDLALTEWIENAVMTWPSLKQGSNRAPESNSVDPMKVATSMRLEDSAILSGSLNPELPVKLVCGLFEISVAPVQT